ncbi:transcription initiation factor TFIID subunit 9B [Kwoniella mangroviensis CBS 10435]|uniref:Transcription initiation factor TFIID subunit 9B n=1 Tax=Kwoniella mangroviensis CBS 10435 TaxID=1331196 RepID=A0A1B9IVX5_9TREE|nr:transcription initiation factor TFIID subunit 9B [Kwoniella mangroviensis CBS 10435]
MANQTRPFPRDGRLISLILASKGIEDTDDRVIHQLLDFAHRYTADVLQSAQSLSDHASRSGPSSNKIQKEDVELAIQLRKRYEFFEAPPRDYLATLAHELNSQPLPILPESFDLIKLPPAHQRLGEVNFDIVPEPDLNLTENEEEEEDEDASGSEEEDQDQDQDQDQRSDGGDKPNGVAEEDGDEDEDMEEVGLTDQTQQQQQQQREVDEDYDI